MKRLLLYLFSIVLCRMPMVAAANAAGDNTAGHERTKASWKIRYLIFVSDPGSMKKAVEVAGRRNHGAQISKTNDPYLMAAEFFDPATLLPVKGTAQVALFLVPFDHNGNIRSSNRGLNELRGQRTNSDDIVAVNKKSRAARQYYLADWSQGIPGNAAFSPGVCTGWEYRRYENTWDTDSYSGNFGCREWTAQLYQQDSKYIDVTSYSSHGNFIGEFVGWSRFGDPPKPVIGMQGDTWLCLHECPHGEKPGIIRDIKAWTEKHHFPLPSRPKQQPEFPNSKFEDDLKEEFQD